MPDDQSEIAEKRALYILQKKQWRERACEYSGTLYLFIFQSVDPTSDFQGVCWYVASQWLRCVLQGPVETAKFLQYFLNAGKRYVLEQTDSPIPAFALKRQDTLKERFKEYEKNYPIYEAKAKASSSDADEWKAYLEALADWLYGRKLLKLEPIKTAEDYNVENYAQTLEAGLDEIVGRLDETTPTRYFVFIMVGRQSSHAIGFVLSRNGPADIYNEVLDTETGLFRFKDADALSVFVKNCLFPLYAASTDYYGVWIAELGNKPPAA